MEPRVAICAYDEASGRFTLTTPSQGVFAMKGQFAEILGVPPEKVRILTYNVGGSFGMKASIYPEYVPLAHAARALGRPVKWTDERSGSFVSDHHGRDHEMTAELALDEDGKFLALRMTWLRQRRRVPRHGRAADADDERGKERTGVYRTPLIEVSSKIMFTNTSPVSAYRGAGRPEANYYMERLIDTAAREMGIDRLELRRRNHVRPGEIPYKAASDMVYDSGDFGAVFEEALAAADGPGSKSARPRAGSAGSCAASASAATSKSPRRPTRKCGGLRFEADGTVTLVTGTLDYGQGHAAPFAQVLCSRLGIPFDRIRLAQSDTDELVFGAGTGGSRTIDDERGGDRAGLRSGHRERAQLAGEALEAAAGDIEFRAGRFVVAGTDRAIGLIELAAKLRGMAVPEGLPKTLDVTHVTEVIPSAFPNGCHVAEVEIDPETGAVEVARYSSVNDFGTIVNPLLVEGQIHGGVVQGIGQCFMETVIYDETGQLLTGSFMDYALPRATDFADAIGFASHAVPATTNPLGAKGCGEAGCAGAIVSVMNAVVDALAERGIPHFDMPASPQRVWQALRGDRP